MVKILNNSSIKGLRRKLRQDMLKGEKLLWSKLKNRQLGFKFRRQYSFNNYIVDFYCPECMIGVEVDGLTHEGKVEYDERRQNYIENLGIKIIRFRSDEVIYDLDRVLQQIHYICELN